MEIMEDKGSWIFTDEQIEKIKNFSAEDISKFYNDNYDILLRMAKHFISKKRRCGLYCYNLQDLMHQIYVDIPYYRFNSRFALYMSIVKGSFNYANCGGINVRHKSIPEYNIMSFSLDSEDDKDMLLDYFSSYEEPVYNFENPIKDREEKDKKIIEFLEKNISNPKTLNTMFCKLFTDIPSTEIKGDEYEFYKKCQK